MPPPAEFTIKVRQHKRPGERPHRLGEWTTDLSKTITAPNAEASESDVLSLSIYPPPGTEPAVRVRVGSVLVASSLPADRAAPIGYDDTAEDNAPPLVCKGRLLADCVGLTELVVECRRAGAASWAEALVLPLAVSAGKLLTEEFNQLFAELEQHSAAVLLDIHGKTRVGLTPTQPRLATSPVAVLLQLRESVTEMTTLLHQMARQPASRLHAQSSREQALLGQAVSETTLAEACRDPSLLGQCGNQLVFREHVREHSRPDFRIPEHRIIAGFGEYLKDQLGDLRHRIDMELADRTDRKRWRNHAKQPGQPTWWEAEDWPRIEELQKCRDEVTRLRGAVDGWGNLPFLPVGERLRQKPQSTSLFRNHAVYRRAFRVIAGHLVAYRATLDTHHLLTRARSLPVLYEWWCAVKMIRILSRGLAPLLHDPDADPIVSIPGLAQESRRFSIEFASDQAINFRDRNGARVRFRYQPRYDAPRGAAATSVGCLAEGAIRTPDITLEVFPARSSPADVPELIVVLDAKYSSATQWQKLNEVTVKYSRLGNRRTGRTLSRQVWALTPVAPEGGAAADGLRHFCTVDNAAFWSSEFDPASLVNGAVQTRPVSPGAFDPLEVLIVKLLKLAGVEYAATSGPERE